MKWGASIYYISSSHKTMEINTITYNGKKYKHISAFKKKRNTINQYLFRILRLKKHIDYIELPQGRWIAESEWSKFD